MAEAIVSEVTKTVLEYLQQLAVDKIAPYFGGKKKVEDLKGTMEMIQARLRDAERRGEGEREEVVKLWLKRLKRLLHRIEDLLEEVALDDGRGRQGGNKLFNKQPHFRSLIPSRKNKKWAKEAAYITRELERITKDMVGLNFRELPPLHEQPRLVDYYKDSRETSSYVAEGGVIGREDDKKKIISMLLDTAHADTDVSVIPIIGMDGLGKTTLAQLVFNDEDVQRHFDLKAWAFISETSSLKELARIILGSLTTGDCDKVSLQGIQDRLCEAVKDRKYLLVLDDVWDEEDEWALKVLHLPRTLTRLQVYDWKGVSFPGHWSPTDLVSLDISGCEKCRHLPALSRLPNLERLRLEHLMSLEYIESGGGGGGYPSLNHLVLYDLPELKGWTKARADLLFPRLSRLHISFCEVLARLPLVAPKLQDLDVSSTGGKLLKHLASCPALERLVIDHVKELDPFSLQDYLQGLKCLRYLSIRGNSEMESLPDSVGCLSALETLYVEKLDNLTALPDCIGHLPRLAEVSISNCRRLASLPESFRHNTNCTFTIVLSYTECMGSQMPQVGPLFTTSLNFTSWGGGGDSTFDDEEA